MPTKIPMRQKVTNQQPGWKTLFLMTGELPDDDEDGINPFETLDWEFSSGNPDPAKAFWLQEKEQLLKGWVKSYPGTRPFAWWRYDAPEPRNRIGGSGLPISEVTAIGPVYRFGLSNHWVTPSFRKYQTPQRIIDARVDEDNPPIYESQAAYLDRLGLLLKAEQVKADFSPEILKIDFETGELL